MFMRLIFCFFQVVSPPLAGKDGRLLRASTTHVMHWQKRHLTCVTASPQGGKMSSKCRPVLIKPTSLRRPRGICHNQTLAKAPPMSPQKTPIGPVTLRPPYNNSDCSFSRWIRENSALTSQQFGCHTKLQVGHDALLQVTNCKLYWLNRGRRAGP